MKYHAQFLLDKEKDKSNARVRFRIKWEGNILAFNLGYRIEIDKWIADIQRCKANTTHGKDKVPASIINRKLQQFEEACEDTFKYFEVKKTIPTKEVFKNYFNNLIGREKRIVLEKSFSEYFDDFLTEFKISKQLSYKSAKNYITTKNKILEFDKNISFEDFTREKLTYFIAWLQDNFSSKNRTVKKHIIGIKTFLRWANQKKLHTNREYEDFNPTFKNTEQKVIFLTPTEFQEFKNFEIPTEYKYLELTKDIFLFQCYTGLRYSDVVNLKKGDIKEGYIEITTMKTTDSLQIELNKSSRMILEKYKDFVSQNNKALPTINLKQTNKFLKELCRLVGINEPIRQTYYIGSQRIDEIKPKYEYISSHAGRRTFICNAIYLGIPPQVIMKWTGHKNYESMKPYIDIAEEVKQINMKKFDGI